MPITLDQRTFIEKELQRIIARESQKMEEHSTSLKKHSGPNHEQYRKNVMTKLHNTQTRLMKAEDALYALYSVPTV